MESEPRIDMSQVSAKLISNMMHTTLSMRGLVEVVIHGSNVITESSVNLEKSSTRIASVMASNAQNAAIAAALVFQHSACENTLMDLCEALVIRDPSPWLAKIKDKRISFLQVSKKSSGELALELMEEFLKDLERRPLLEKLETLFSVLKPQTTLNIIPGFSYSTDEVRRIDRTRHALVHKPEFTTCGTSLEDIQYLFYVVQMVLLIAEKKYPSGSRASDSDLTGEI